jgi:hypothetical protein
MIPLNGILGGSEAPLGKLVRSLEEQRVSDLLLAS